MLATTCGGASGYELESLEVRFIPPRYSVHMRVRLDVPARPAYELFSNPDNLPQINPSVRSVRRLNGAVAPLQRLFTDIRLCVSLYCRHLAQVQDMHYQPHAEGGRINATVIPELSDLRYGEANWNLHECPGGACLEFRATLEPRFWIPPFIGPWLVQRSLRHEAMQTSAGIERLVHAASPS